MIVLGRTGFPPYARTTATDSHIILLECVTLIAFDTRTSILFSTSAIEKVILETKRGNPCLIVDDYLYHQPRKTKEVISWSCVKKKKYNCSVSRQTHFAEKLSFLYSKCNRNRSKKKTVKRELVKTNQSL